MFFNKVPVFRHTVLNCGIEVFFLLEDHFLSGLASSVPIYDDHRVHFFNIEKSIYNKSKTMITRCVQQGAFARHIKETKEKKTCFY